MSEYSHQEKKELQKVEAFKEHCLALQRHMDNTSNYLQKEVKVVEAKMDEAKQLVLHELGLNLYNSIDYLSEVQSAQEKKLVDAQIREIEEEEQEDDEEEMQETSVIEEEEFGDVDEVQDSQ